MFFSTEKTKMWIFATCAAILCSSLVLGVPQHCDRCLCDVRDTATAESTKQSVLFVDCSKVNTESIVVVPNIIKSYGDLEIHATYEKNFITTIQYGIFKGIRITNLNLANNAINNTMDDAFSKMPNLITLNLNHNKIVESTLTTKTFKGLNKLELLDLSENMITNLDSTIFNELISLKVLKLNTNFLKEVPSDIFITVRSLKMLYLNENSIAIVHEATFKSLGNLECLDISGNLIEEMADDLFQESRLLTDLNISSNKITSLSKYVFKSLSRLTSLNLAKNQLTEMNEEVFVPKSIQILNVGFNKLNKTDFLNQNFDNLRELYLENNNFDDLKVIQKFTQLQILNVSTNTLKSFPDTKFLQLRILDLSDNLFPSIPSIVRAESLPSLNRVILDANPMKEIKFSQSNALFSNLTFVSLSRLSALREIPAGTFTTLRNREINGAVKDKEFRRRKREDETATETETRESEVDDKSEEEKEESDNIKDSKESLNNTKDIDTTSVEKKSENQENIDSDVDAITPNTLENEDEDDLESDDAGEENVSESKTLDNNESKDIRVADDKNVSPKNLENPDIKESEEEDATDTSDSVFDSTSEDIEAVTMKAVTIQAVAIKAVILEEDAKDTESQELDESNENQDGVEKTVQAKMLDEKKEQRSKFEQTGKLRAEPNGMLVKNENKSDIFMPRDCGTRLTLKISGNENLLKIQEDAFKGIDLCEVDLSSNGLMSIPENLLDWVSIRSVNLQYNPWDCNCKLQWILPAYVPRTLAERPSLLYELRCTSPAALNNKRFVHFYNWTKPAFCMDHKMDLVKAVSADPEIEKGNIGSSNGMLIAIGGALFVIVVLVVAGIVYQWRTVQKRRRVNRRI